MGVRQRKTTTQGSYYNSKKATDLESFLDVSRRKSKSGNGDDKSNNNNFERKSKQMLKDYVKHSKQGVNAEEQDLSPYTVIQSFAVSDPLQLRDSKSVDMPMLSDKIKRKARKTAYEKSDAVEKSAKTEVKQKVVKSEMKDEKRHKSETKRGATKLANSQTSRLKSVKKADAVNKKQAQKKSSGPYFVKREEKLTTTKTISKLPPSPQEATYHFMDNQEHLNYQQSYGQQDYLDQQQDYQEYLQQQQMYEAQMEAQNQYLAQLNYQQKAYNYALANQQSAMMMATLPETATLSYEACSQEPGIVANPKMATGLIFLFSMLAMATVYLLTLEDKCAFTTRDYDSYGATNHASSFAAISQT